MRYYALLAATAASITLSGCVIEVKEDAPKGTCLYHCEGKACCEEKATESWCAAKMGTWSNGTKDCP